MSQLTLADIKKLADLAKIEIKDGEDANYLKDINNILGHLAQVGDADTKSVEPNFPFYNFLRNDDLAETVLPFDRDLIFQNIPAKSGNYVKVPKVLKK